MCLDSLIQLMNFTHSSMVSLSKMLLSWFLHVSLWIPNMVMVLFINLILSFNTALSIFLIILQPVGVLMLFLSLILTGIIPTLGYLSKNLCFGMSTILHSNFSHCWNNLTFSISYSDLICRWMFFILLYDVIMNFLNNRTIIHFGNQLLPVYNMASSHLKKMLFYTILRHLKVYGKMLCPVIFWHFLL